MQKPFFKIAIVILGGVLIVGGLAAYFLLVSRKLPPGPTPAASPSPVVEETPPASLGGQIYEKAQNPIQDEVPQTNPFEGVKTNPFR